MSFYKRNKKPSLHGTVDDFFRRPNAGPLAQDLAAAHTTRGKNALLPQLLQHCRVARQDTWLDTFVGKSTNELLQKKQKAFFTRNR